MISQFTHRRIHGAPNPAEAPPRPCYLCGDYEATGDKFRGVDLCAAHKVELMEAEMARDKRVYHGVCP